jgi:hypothetical protein
MPDAPTLIDGDAQFMGVNMLLPPGELPPGVVASARNNRCRYGKMEPRSGVVKLPWTNKVSAGASSVPVPFATTFGAGVFRDVDDMEWLLIAAEGKVYRTRDGSGAAEVQIPPGVVLTDDVTFTQTASGMMLFRGPDASPLRMQTLDGGFVSILTDTNAITGAGTENPADGTQAIPNAYRGDWIGNRLFVPHVSGVNKDLVGISDYFNATRMASVRAQARINQGSNDRLLRVFKFNDDTALCFKESSIYVLTGVQFDLASMRLDELTRAYGLASAKAVVQAGKDCYFLAMKRGVCSVRQTEQNQLQSVDWPASAEIQPLIDRINWDVAARTATMAYWDNKLYVAVPLDDAKMTTAELVSDGLTYDTGLYFFQVIAGASYTWTKGTHEDYLTNGTEILRESGTFTAQGTLVKFTELSALGGSTAVTAGLRRVWIEANNVVLVYDFLKRAWQGYDDGGMALVKEFVLLMFQGEQRIFTVAEDGFINCIEWLPHDEVARENLGDDLLPGGAQHDADGVYTLTGLLAGRTYLYRLQTPSTTIYNGTETLTVGDGQFIAQATSIVVMGTTGAGPGLLIYLLDWGIDYAPIDHEWTSRGYRCQTLARKRFNQAFFNLRTWNPDFTVGAVPEGVEEEQVLSLTGTRSPVNYTRPFTAPAWTPTNLNDDHATPYREDYSVSLNENTVASGSIQPGVLYYVESSDVNTACQITYNGVAKTNQTTFTGVAGVTTFTVDSGTPLVYGPDSYLYLDGAGVDFDLHQESRPGVRLNARGREVQFHFTNAAGRCEVSALEVRGVPVDMSMGAKT